MRKIDEYEAGNVDFSSGGDSGDGNHRVDKRHAMYAALYLDARRAFGARKGHNGVAVDGVDRIPSHLLLRFPVLSYLVGAQQTGHISIHGDH